MSSWEAPGKSDEWYTPPCVFKALGCQFDVDVAGPSTFPNYCPTSAWIHSNSLATRWDGFIWMNPPFGGRNAGFGVLCCLQ